MDKLIDALSVSRKISIIQTKHNDFLNYNALFKVVHDDLKGLVTKNHIFACSDDNDDELWMSIRESNLEDCNETKFLATRQRQRSRTDLEAHMNQLLKPIIAPGINPYKLVELYKKYHPVVPEDYWEDEFYVKPANEVLKKCKEEKVIRKDNQAKVKALKEGEDVKKGGGDRMKKESKK
jgi:hypothetical protein